MAGIEVLVNPMGIPVEKLLLLVPGKRTLSSLCMLDNGVALGFESKQDLFRQRASLTKRDKIRGILAFQVWKHTPRVESRDKMALVVGFRHLCSAAVPGCELWRRPAASLRNTHRDGARTRSRGRLRYDATAGDSEGLPPRGLCQRPAPIPNDLHWNGTNQSPCGTFSKDPPFA